MLNFNNLNRKGVWLLTAKLAISQSFMYICGIKQKNTIHFLCRNTFFLR